MYLKLMFTNFLNLFLVKLFSKFDYKFLIFYHNFFIQPHAKSSALILRRMSNLSSIYSLSITSVKNSLFDHIRHPKRNSTLRHSNSPHCPFITCIILLRVLKISMDFSSLQQPICLFSTRHLPNKINFKNKKSTQ